VRQRLLPIIIQQAHSSFPFLLNINPRNSRKEIHRLQPNNRLLARHHRPILNLRVMHAAKRVPDHDIFIPDIRPPIYRFTLLFRGCASLSSISAGFDPGRYTLAHQ
jgi:hypothetical protein